MKAVLSAVVVLSLLSLTGIAWLADRQRAEPSSLLVPMQPRTTGQHFVLAEGQPLILLGFHSEEGRPHLEVRDRQGRIQWTHRL